MKTSKRLIFWKFTFLSSSRRREKKLKFAPQLLVHSAALTSYLYSARRPFVKIAFNFRGAFSSHNSHPDDATSDIDFAGESGAAWEKSDADAVWLNTQRSM